jgi:hypothetical protein
MFFLLCRRDAADHQGALAKANTAITTTRTHPTNFRMSALGHKQTFCDAEAMSALPSKADIPGGDQHVCFVPKAEIRQRISREGLDLGPITRIGSLLKQ